MRRDSGIGNNELLLLLIDENPDSFKRGTIVTATIAKYIQEKGFICRLENDLEAFIPLKYVTDTSEN